MSAPSTPSRSGSRSTSGYSGKPGSPGTKSGKPGKSGRSGRSGRSGNRGTVSGKRPRSESTRAYPVRRPGVSIVGLASSLTQADKVDELALLREGYTNGDALPEGRVLGRDVTALVTTLIAVSRRSGTYAFQVGAGQ